MRTFLTSIVILALLAGGGVVLERTGYLSGLLASIGGRSAIQTGKGERAKLSTTGGGSTSPVEVAAASIKQMSDDISAIGTLDVRRIRPDRSRNERTHRRHHLQGRRQGRGRRGSHKLDEDSSAPLAR